MKTDLRANTLARGFLQDLVRVFYLYREGKLYNSFITTILVIIGMILCYPGFYFGYPFFHYWEKIKRKLLAHLGVEPFQGEYGLPLIGETIDFKTNSDLFFKIKRRRFGNVFSTRLYLSDRASCSSSIHVQQDLAHSPASSLTTEIMEKVTNSLPILSRKAVCVFELPSIYLPKDKLGQMSYIGYFGSQIASQAMIKKYDRLYQHVFSLSTSSPSSHTEYHRKLFRCEHKIQQLTQSFLKRLMYESSFTFSEKVDQLCCEVMSTFFLGMKGLSPSLLQAMNVYLTQSYRDIRYFHCNNPEKDIIMNHLLVAIFEEDRLFYQMQDDTSSVSSKRGKAMTMDVLTSIGEIFPETHQNEREKIEIFFIFFVEYLYGQSVDLLRKALAKLLIDSRPKDPESFYKRLQRLKFGSFATTDDPASEELPPPEETEALTIETRDEGENECSMMDGIERLSRPPSTSETFTPFKSSQTSRIRAFSEDVLYRSPLKTGLMPSVSVTSFSAVTPVLKSSSLTVSPNTSSKSLNTDSITTTETNPSSVLSPTLTTSANTEAGGISPTSTSFNASTASSQPLEEEPVTSLPDSIPDLIESLIMEVKSEHSRQSALSYSVFRCDQRTLISSSSKIKPSSVARKNSTPTPSSDQKSISRQEMFTVRKGSLLLEIYDPILYHQEDCDDLPLIELSTDTLFDSMLRIFLGELLEEYDWQTMHFPAEAFKPVIKDRDKESFSLIKNYELPICCFRQKHYY